jgi:hypothetical protein
MGDEAAFLIVVGSGGTAAGIAQDLAGLINVAARLGGETVTTEGAAEVVEGGAKIESPGTDLTYDDKLVTVLGGAVKAIHLPNVLADGTYNGEVTSDADYDQEITFNANSPVMQMDIDEDDANEAAGAYMFFDKDYIIYTYELDFEDDVEFDGSSNDEAEDDLVNTEIEILGKTYTISSVTVSSDEIDTLTLLGGASEATVDDEETITVTLDGTEYEVTPSIYGDSSVTFTVEFDGNVETTDELAEGETDELSDETEIGVRDILYSSKETKTSAVTFYLGAQSIELDDNGDIKLNGEKLEDYTATSDFSDNNDAWEWLTITLQADDDMWLAEGEEWVDPLFGSWKLSFTGKTWTTEEFDWDSSSEDEAYFTFINVNGDEVELPAGIYDTGTDVVAWGDPDQSHFWDNSGTVDADGEGSNETGMAWMDGEYCGVTVGAGLTDECDDFLFVGISAGGEAHLFRVEDVDVAGDQIKLRDETLSKDLEDGDWIDTTAAIDTAIGDLDIDLDDDNVTFTDIDLSGTGDLVTALAGVINLGGAGGANYARVIVEDNDGNQDTIDFVSDGAASPVIEVDASDIANLMDIEDDSDKQIGTDNHGWGTWYTLADETEDTQLTALYPEEEVILNAYVLESTGAVSGTSSAGRSGVIKNNIAIVDTEVESSHKSNYHMILGGGPAVNKLSAEALGLNYPTYGADSGIPEDGYMISLVPDAFVEGQYALVIAGWESEQTTDAMAKVQANMASVSGNTYYYPAAPADDEEE